MKIIETSLKTQSTMFKVSYYPCFEIYHTVPLLLTDILQLYKNNRGPKSNNNLNNQYLKFWLLQIAVIIVFLTCDWCL